MSEEKIEKLKALLRRAYETEFSEPAEFEKVMAEIGKIIYIEADTGNLTLKDTTGGYSVEINTWEG